VTTFILTSMKLDDEVYARLLALRVSLRRFERWSAQQAQAAGLTPAQHQLLLAIRGHDDPRGPTTGELAEYLLLQHHSTVGLIDRAEAAGLVTRTRADEDHRVVRLNLTKAGTRRLDGLSAAHLEELTRLTPYLPGAWDPPLTAPVPLGRPDCDPPSELNARGSAIPRPPA
jgi:DNA-binding MarR family transcriptional regulator